MIVEFEENWLKELYEIGKASDKKHRYQPEIIRRYKDCINLMRAVNKLEDLYQYHSLNYKILTGNMTGIHSVRVNNRYRIEFTAMIVEQERITTICNIIELSNHYQ